jgi:hypothetical protein
MITFLRLLGLACIAAAAVGLSVASHPTLAVLGCGLLIGLGVMGFGLCVMSGEVTDQDRDEANGLHHPDDLEGKN